LLAGVVFAGSSSNVNASPDFAGKRETATLSFKYSRDQFFCPHVPSRGISKSDENCSFLAATIADGTSDA
jgi:hypothetical protein